MQVYEASLAVLLLGYCEDCRIHQGKPALSPRRLVETLQVLHLSLPLLRRNRLRRCGSWLHPA